MARQQKKIEHEKIDPNEPVVFGDHKCRTCNSDRFEHVCDLPSTVFAAQLADGSKYTSVVRDRVKCLSCGQSSNRLRYKYDPALWQD